MLLSGLCIDITQCKQKAVGDQTVPAVLASSGLWYSDVVC